MTLRSSSKPSLLLLDTNIVIECFRLNIWEKLIGHYQVVLGAIVLKESEYYKDEMGRAILIDLKKYISDQKISVIDATIEETTAFKSKFKPNYIERFDPGELELLTHWSQSKQFGAHISSADGIVFKTMASMGHGDKGISLEELLKDIAGGKVKKLAKQFTKSFRDKYTKEGSIDRISEFKA